MENQNCNRQHEAAARIQRQYGVRVEYVPLMREYIIDGCMVGSSARKAEQMARRYRRELQIAE
jgi:hypothetical protein